MDRQQLPDRDRWDGWVTFAWFIVAFSVIGGIVLIGSIGTIEIPERDFRGAITWREEPNFVVWGAAIGQAVGVAMLAAIFSILNSTYKNSCDILKVAIDGGDKGSTNRTLTTTPRIENSSTSEPSSSTSSQVTEPQKNAPYGAIVSHVETTSPFYCLLQPGYSIVKTNGMTVETEKDFKNVLKKGKNIIEFSDQEGKIHSINIRLNPNSFGVYF